MHRSIIRRTTLSELAGGAAGRSVRPPRSVEQLSRTFMSSSGSKVSKAAAGAKQPVGKVKKALAFASVVGTATYFGNARLNAEFDQRLQIPTEQIEAVAVLVTERLNIPFLPATLQHLIVCNVVKAVLRGLCCALNPSQREHLLVALEGEMTDIEAEAFVQELATQLQPGVSVPFFDETQQHELLSSVLRAIFTTIGKDRAEHLPYFSADEILKFGVHTAKDLLSEKDRESLAEQLSQSIPLPSLVEEPKRAAIKSLLDGLSKILEKQLPASALTFLKDPANQNQAAFRQQLVDAACKELESPLLPEQQKASIITFVVDKLYLLFLSNTSAEEALLNATPEQREKRLMMEEKKIQREIALAESDARRRQRMLQRKLERIQERKDPQMSAEP